MARALPRQPTLYKLTDSPAELIRLKGGKCRCGYLFFPYHTYGCEKCGASADATQPFPLAARGILVSVAEVFRPHARGINPPYLIGTIELDVALRVQAILEGSKETLQIGQRVSAVAVAGLDSKGREVLDCRFAAERDG